MRQDKQRREGQDKDRGEDMLMKDVSLGRITTW